MVDWGPLPNTHIRFQTQQNSCTEKEGHRRRLTNKTSDFVIDLPVPERSDISKISLEIRFRVCGSCLMSQSHVFSLCRKNLAVDCIFQSNFLDINWAADGEWIHNNITRVFLARSTLLRWKSSNAVPARISKQIQCILSCGQSYLSQNEKQRKYWSVCKNRTKEYRYLNARNFNSICSFPSRPCEICIFAWMFENVYMSFESISFMFKSQAK